MGLNRVYLIEIGFYDFVDDIPIKWTLEHVLSMKQPQVCILGLLYILFKTIELYFNACV